MNKSMTKIPDRYLQPMESETFWKYLSPGEHLVQVYERETVFLDSLESFVAAGLARHEAVIVIGTQDHLKVLAGRLRATGYDLDSAIAMKRYLALGLEETLQRFMRDGMPDEALFKEVIGELLLQARSNAVRVRAFGEMVALLWEQGEYDATIRLEELWHQACEAEGLCLFCAYPQSGFRKGQEDDIEEIHAHHTRSFLA